MSQKGYIHLYGNCLYSKVKFPVDRSSYNARSTIFLIVFNLLIVILSSFCRWIQAPCLRKSAVRNIIKLQDVWENLACCGYTMDGTFLLVLQRCQAARVS